MTTPPDAAAAHMSPAAAEAVKAYLHQAKDLADALALETQWATTWALNVVVYGPNSVEERQAWEKWNLAAGHRAHEAAATEARRQEATRAVEADVGRALPTS